MAARKALLARFATSAFSIAIRASDMTVVHRIDGNHRKQWPCGMKPLLLKNVLRVSTTDLRYGKSPWRLKNIVILERNPKRRSNWVRSASDTREAKLLLIV